MARSYRRRCCRHRESEAYKIIFPAPGAATLRWLTLTVPFARPSGSGDLTRRLLVPHAGLPWGVKVASDSGTETQIRDRIEAALKDRAWSAWMDGQHSLAPSGALHGQGLSRNAWGCFPNPASWAYFPSHQFLAEVATHNNAWLTNMDGEPINTRWGIRLFDIRVPVMGQAFLDQTKLLMDRFKSPLLFLDELHGSAYVSTFTGTELPGWDDAYRKILRKIGRKVIRNGTFPLDLSAMFDGFYIQNFHYATFQLETIADSVLRGYKHTCLQVPADVSFQYQAMIGDAPGVSIQEIPLEGGQFSFAAPAVILEPNIKIMTDGNQSRVMVR